MPKEDTQFKKGQSGNPGGRPAGTGLTKILSNYLECTEEGSPRTRREALVVKLYEMAMSGDTVAIKYIFDRVDGKVPEIHQLSDPDGGSIDFKVNINVIK